jgi:hypothetical protein
MNHWEITGRIGQEHRADLDREADRFALAKQSRAVRGATAGHKAPAAGVGLLARLRSLRPGAAGRVGRVFEAGHRPAR